MNHMNVSAANEKLGLSPREARVRSGLGLKNLYKAMNTGELPSRKYGKRRIILASDLQAFLERLPVSAPKSAAA